MTLRRVEPGAGESVKSTLLYSLRFVGVYAALAVISAVVNPRPGWSSATSFGKIVAFYLGCALFIGGAVGIVRRFITTRVRAAVLGFFLAMPVEVVIAYTFGSRHYSGSTIFIASILFGIFGGAVYGAILWDPPRGRG